MKRAWDPTTLTVNFWNGPDPEAGDGLETSTGRRYLIVRLKYGRWTRTAQGETVTHRRGPLRALECIVLPRDERIDGTIFRWEWSQRTRTQRRTLRYEKR